MSDWAKYLYESIYVVWIELLCYSLIKYMPVSPKLMQYAKQTVQFVRKQLKHIWESEQVYKCLFEACGKCKLPDEARSIYEDMKSNKIEVDKVTMGAFFHALTTASDF